MRVNGDLEFLVAGAGELKNAVIESLASDPGTGVVAGRIYYNTTSNVYRFYNGTVWASFDAGGATQTELDTTQTSMGYVNVDGTFNAAVLNALGNITGLTGSDDLVAALTQLDAAITAAAGVDTLAELTDVNLSGLAEQDLLSYDNGAGEWVNRDRNTAGVVTTDTTQSVSGAKTFSSDVTVTADINAAAGSAAGPSIYLNGDSDTGLYQSAANEIAIAAAGANIVVVDANGIIVDNVVESQGTFVGPTGDAGAPTYTFTGDTDTGFYSTGGGGGEGEDWGISFNGAMIIGSQSGLIVHDNPDGDDNGALDATAYAAALSNDYEIPNKKYVDDEIAAAGIAELGDIGDVNLTAPADSHFLVYTGSAWVNEAPATARTSLGVYSTTEADTNFVDVSGDTMTGALLLPDGTAGAPALSFSSDPNTGLYSVGANVLGMATDGTVRMQLNTSELISSVSIRTASTNAFFNNNTAGDFVAFRTVNNTGATGFGTGTTSSDVAIFTGSTRRLEVESNGTLNVAGTTDYETLVTADDDIPNKKYVDDEISAAVGSTTLAALTDTDVTLSGGPNDDDMLVYNSSTTDWENQNPSEVRTNLGLVAGGVGDIWVEKAGDTMTGNLIMSSATITGLPSTPSAATEAASKAYVDQLVASNTIWQDPIEQPDLVDILATEPATPIESGMYIAYNDGAGTGFPQSWTGSVTVNEYDMVHYTGGAWEVSGNIDGVETRIGVAFNVTGLDNEGTMPTGMVKDDLAVYQGAASADPTDIANWDFPHGRAGGVAFNLVSTTSATKTFVITGDVSNSFKVDNTFTVAGSTANVNDGTYTIASVSVSGNTTVTVDETVPSDDGATGTAEPEIRNGITVLCDNPDDSHFGQSYLYSADSDAWVIISGPGTITAGVGLSFSGSTMNVNLGAGIFELPSDEVGIELHDGATGAIILTDDGSTRATTSSSKLHLLLNGGSLVQGASGLSVAASTFTGDTGSDATVLPGETMNFIGGTGLSSTVAANGSDVDVTFDAAVATEAASQGSGTLGIAEFADGDFVVTSGFVELDPVGVQESISLTFSPSSGDDIVLSGATDTINIDSNTLTVVGTVGTSTIDIDLNAILSDLNDVYSLIYGTAGGESTYTTYDNRIYNNNDDLLGNGFHVRQSPLGNPAGAGNDPFFQGTDGISGRNRGAQVLAWDGSHDDSGNGGNANGAWMTLWTDGIVQASGMDAFIEWNANARYWDGAGAFQNVSGSAWADSPANDPACVFARWDDANNEWRNFTPAQMVAMLNAEGGLTGISGSITLAGDAGTPQTIDLGDTLTIAGGTGIDTTAGATDTVTVSLNATISDLTDVTITSASEGDALVYDGSSDFVNRPFHFVSTLQASNTSHSISHSLAQQYVNVTVVDSSDQVIIPQSITMTDANTVTVTLSSAAQVRVICTGIEGV